ncbi:UNVERIFIED_CONTAM: hypothetical protein HDU68_009758, partial [Siphonaria sp. JEL0065]
MFTLQRLVSLARPHGVRFATTTSGSTPAALAAAFQVRTLLDTHSAVEAVSKFRELDGTARSALSAADGERLLLAVASGAAGVHGQLQRGLVETLYSLYPTVHGAGVAAVLETRALSGDVEGFANVRFESADLALDVDVVVPLALEALARAKDFAAAEILLSAFVRRHYGDYKLKADEMSAFLVAEKARRVLEYAKNRRAVEERVISHLDKNTLPKSADQSVPTTAAEKREKSLLQRLLDLTNTKPVWRRHPPLPRDASPALIKKRTRPTPPNQNALMLTTYSSLMKAYASTNDQEATLRLLSLIQSFTPLTKLAPNNTIYSIAMSPFVNAKDILTVRRLRDEAFESGLQPSIVLSTRVLATCVKTQDFESAKREIQTIQTIFTPLNTAPTTSLLREMMRAYALDSQSGTHAPEAWGIIKTVIQAAKSKSTPLEEIYLYAQDLARANGALEQGKEVSTWD